MNGREKKELVEYLAWRDSLPNVRHLSPESAWGIFRDAHHGRCAICRREDRRLVVDHCHETGWIRGLLCDSCNLAMPGRIATIYEGLPPAHVAGLFRKYVQRSWGQDPAERFREILWHVGSDGSIEPDWEVSGRARVKLMQKEFDARQRTTDPPAPSAADPRLCRKLHANVGAGLRAKLEREARWAGSTVEAVIVNLIQEALTARENPSEADVIWAVQNRRPGGDVQP